MTRAEVINAKILEAEEWAQDQVSALEYRQARPPNFAVDPCGWYAHQARPWAEEVAAIEEALAFVSECLNADLFREERPSAPNAWCAEALARFD